MSLKNNFTRESQAPFLLCHWIQGRKEASGCGDPCANAPNQSFSPSPAPPPPHFSEATIGLSQLLSFHPLQVTTDLAFACHQSPSRDKASVTFSGYFIGRAPLRSQNVTSFSTLVPPSESISLLFSASGFIPPTSCYLFLKCS